MALRSDSEFSDDVSQGAGTPAPSGPEKKTGGSSTPPLSRNGGARTQKASAGHP